MASMNIYFSDLTETAQKELLETAGISNETEMNWDVFHVTTVEFDENED